jgi:hypothetical protein
MPYGYGNVPGSTITGPLAKINSDSGRIVSDGSGTLNAEAFVAMTGPSYLGPAGFFSDGGTIYSNGSGNLTCNSLTVGDGSWYSSGEIICRQIRSDNWYSWSIETNGAMRFDGGSIWSDSYGSLYANRFYGDGGGLSYVYASGGYADQAGNSYSADWANNAGSAYSAYQADNAYNADWANNANYAYDAGNAYNANYANDSNYAYNSYQAYQSDYANYANNAYQADNAYNADYASCAYRVESWSDCAIYANCFVNTLQVATGNGLPPYPANGTIASDGEYLYVYINGWRKLAFAD